VGSRLVKRLRSENVNIVERDLRSGIDITDWEAVKNIDGIDILVHLAASTSVPGSFGKPREFLNTNFKGTLNMLEVCRKCNGRMIYASSALVYGIPKYLAVDEIHPVDGVNPYAVSKIIGEELCKGYYRAFNLKTIIARSFNIYGPFQTSDSLISSILKQAKKGKAVLRDPLPKRDYIYIDDVVNAYVKMCEYHKSDFEIFNIGTGESHSVEDVARMMVKTLGNNVDIEFTYDKRSNEIEEIRAEISKARELMGWEPQFDLKMGIQRILNDG